MDLSKPRVNILSYLNFKPGVVYDIGAHEGKWTQEFKNYFISSNFIMFEADPAREVELAKVAAETNSNYIIQLLAERPELREFYQSTSEFTSGNSMYRENTRAYDDRYLKKIMLAAKTLDQVIDEFKLPMPDMIKIDVQGAELDVLNGARKAMQNCQMLLLELTILPYNSGAPDFLTVLNYLRSKNFELYDIIHIHYYHGIMSQIDAIFVPTNSPLRPRVVGGVLQDITGFS